MVVRGRAGRWATAALVGGLLAGCADAAPDDSAPDRAGQDGAATGADGTAVDAGEDPSAGGATDEVLTVAAEGLDLVGTLRLPAGDPPFPVVAIAHGSGPQSRAGLQPGQLGLTLPRPVAAYDELAAGLRDRGYAVATWDKRSCGPFNGCADNGYPPPPDDLTFATFVDDVDAVLDTLALRDDLDRLVLVGHSKGGTVGTELLDRRDDLAALVLLAAPAVPIDEVLATQADTLAELVAATGSSVPAEAAVAEVRDLAAQVASIADGEVEGPDVGGVSRAFWASWAAASERGPALARAATTPILAVGGEHDWNVPPEQVEAWGPELPAGSEVRVVPDLTHALTRLELPPGSVQPIDVGTEVDPRVIDLIADWLDTTVR